MLKTEIGVRVILKTVCLYPFCAVYSFTHHVFRRTLVYRVALSDHLSEKYTVSHLFRGGNGPSAHPLHPAPGFTVESISAPLYPIISQYFTRLPASVPACSSLYLIITPPLPLCESLSGSVFPRLSQRRHNGSSARSTEASRGDQSV